MTTAADKEPTEEDDLGPADLLAADRASMCDSSRMGRCVLR